MIIRRMLAWWIAELAQRLVRFGVWVSGDPVRLPSRDDVRRFEAWDAAWQRPTDGGSAVSGPTTDDERAA